MKNDMKLIMESWRKQNLHEQTINYPPDSVFQFLDDLTKGSMIGEDIESKIIKAIKTTADKQDSQKSNRIVKSIAQKGLLMGLSLYVTVQTGGLNLLAGAGIGLAIDQLASSAVEKAKELIDVFNIPDQDRAQYPTAELWDISDDFIKLLKGPDEKYDKPEFKVVAEVYINVIRVLQQLKKEEDELMKGVRSGTKTQQDYIDFLKQPVSGLLPKADIQAKEKLSTELGLNADLKIPKP